MARRARAECVGEQSMRGIYITCDGERRRKTAHKVARGTRTKTRKEPGWGGGGSEVGGEGRLCDDSYCF